MQRGIYNESKLAWWYSREGGLPEAPKQVQLILSALCNQSCVWCAYRMDGYTSNQLFVGNSELAKIGHNNPKRWMPGDRAIKLLNEIKESGALSVQFTGGGEPTVHPDHEAIFDHALSLGLRCSLVSNSISWKPSLIENTLPKFDWVRVSVDAPDASEYAKTRRAPERHWKKAWDNIHALARAIRKGGSHTTLGLSYVVTPESWHGILRFTELASKSGADNARFTAMFSTEDEEPFVDIYDDIRRKIDKAKLMETPNFRVYDNFGSRFEDLKQHAPDYSTCAYQHYTTYIGDDMQAYRCCVLAYNERGKIEGGDLSKRSFSEFWASRTRKDDFRRFNSLGCERCQFNGRNRAVLYLMDDKPEHIEWP